MVPAYLKKGDLVGIVSTARKIKSEDIIPAVHVLESWDLRVEIGNTIGLEHDQFAGKDEERAADLQKMLDDKEIKAIICARGGYGTVRIIDRLDFTKFRMQPKWLIGYSDVTVLHSHIHNDFEIPTIHATMPINFPKNTTSSLTELKQILFGDNITYALKGNPLNRSGKANGTIVGGNLSVLYSLLGSSSDIDTRGKILFIEDVDEYLYHIDRMIMNLKRNKKLENLKGLIVGQFSQMNDNEVPYGKTAEEIISEAIQEYDYPVCFGFPAGHEKENLPIILGLEASIKVELSSVSFKQNQNI